jgi:DNA-binding transcriptional LysR family regulator
MELSEIEAFVTISRRIELLERELGAPVFERLAGSIRLTVAGESFLPYA